MDKEMKTKKDDTYKMALECGNCHGISVIDIARGLYVRLAVVEMRCSVCGCLGLMNTEYSSTRDIRILYE